MTQIELLKVFFKKHPKRPIQHPEVVDWATKAWQETTGTVFRDPDRGIRKLAQEGFLIKLGKGVYIYDPDKVRRKTLSDFTAEQKEEIKKRDHYRCVICGKGEADGIELHIDHIKPKDLGGEASIENGQVLCARHNFMKKNLHQTETGKKMFIRLYELARKEGHKSLAAFCMDRLMNVTTLMNTLSGRNSAPSCVKLYR